jgi:hypothetical protein
VSKQLEHQKFLIGCLRTELAEAREAVRVLARNLADFTMHRGIDGQMLNCASDGVIANPTAYIALEKAAKGCASEEKHPHLLELSDSMRIMFGILTQAWAAGEMADGCGKGELCQLDESDGAEWITYVWFSENPERIGRWGIKNNDGGGVGGSFERLHLGSVEHSHAKGVIDAALRAEAAGDSRPTIIRTTIGETAGGGQSPDEAAGAKP